MLFCKNVFKRVGVSYFYFLKVQNGAKLAEEKLLESFNLIKKTTSIPTPTSKKFQNIFFCNDIFKKILIPYPRVGKV